MHTLSRALSGVVVATALTACRDPLAVQNRNNPDRLRVLATATDLETYTAGAFRMMHQGSIGANAAGSGGSIASLARASSWEVTAAMANCGYLNFQAIPRTAIDNSRGNRFNTAILTDFARQSSAARAAADGLNRLTLGGVSLPSAAQNARLKAFAWFTLGVALGNLSLVYDSAAIVDPYADLAFVPPLSGYREVAAAALTDLDSALAWASATGTNGFSLPSTWINGNALTAAQFIQLVRSYKAHVRADVARTEAEGDAVDWQAVLADASNGITADLQITTQSSPFWGIGVCYWFTGSQVTQFIAGMADTSGGYEAWLRAPLGNKVPFLVVTPDRRFPQGTTRAAQRTNSPTTPTGMLYFANRTTGDMDAGPYGTSFYYWYRFWAWWMNPAGGPYPVFSHNQNDMLQAEAYLRTGNVPAAAALIDLYRMRAGLPALSGVITALGQPVPGGAACVPRVPVGTGPEWTGSTCGDIWEAMKWEFRMENMFIGYSSWYFPSRRWGDLPEGTPLHWPVPYQEMDARRHPFYNLGGVGGVDGAVGKGTYGL